MGQRRWAGSVVAAAAALLMVGVSPTAASRSGPSGKVLPNGATARVSVSSTGGQGNDDSGTTEPESSLAVSANGRFVAFASEASNLVPGDTNDMVDLFMRDRWTGTTRLLSVGRNRAPADGASYDPAISANGRFVAFGSDASNLVPGDTNDATDTFVRDRWTGTTRRVSVGPQGAQGDSTSTWPPAISANGRFIAFASNASNLVAGDTNDAADIFVRDRWTRTTRRVSVDAHGTQANDGSLLPAISANGRFVAFHTDATNLASPVHPNGIFDVYLRDRWTGTTRRMTLPYGETDSISTLTPWMSANGRFVLFISDASNVVPGDTNGAFDVFVRDRWTGRTDRVSISTSGTQPNSDSTEATISANGRFVAFESYASNLVPSDANGWSDIFLRDRWTGTTTRVSVSTYRTQSNGTSLRPAISADGRFVVFSSDATNLLGFSQDTNKAWDVFIHRR